MGVDTQTTGLLAEPKSEYEANFEAWIKSLSPVERAKARAMGVDKPVKQTSRCIVFDSDGQEYDPTDAYQSATWMEKKRMDSDEDYSDERRQLWESVERLTLEFLESKDVLLSRDLFLFIVSIYRDMGIEEQVYATHGKTQLEFLELAVDFMERVGFSPENPQQFKLFRRIARHIAIGADPEMSFDVLAITTHLGVRFGISLRTASTKYCVTVATLSKRSVALRDAMELENLWKSEESRAKYRLCNKRNYKRN